jgi:hypothetical protein
VVGAGLKGFVRSLICVARLKGEVLPGDLERGSNRSPV